MYKQIKELADEAIALQNKDRMDAALREIVVLCGQAESIDHGFVYASGAHHHPGAAEKSVTCTMEMPRGAMKITSIGGVPVGAPNPVVLDGPVGEIVARCPEADAYIAAHVAPAPEPAATEPVKTAKPAKKGGAK